MHVIKYRLFINQLTLDWAFAMLAGSFVALMD